MTEMAKTHPHAEAVYGVVELPDGAFGVKVSIADTHPTVVSAFATEADAEAWITKHKTRVKDYGTTSVQFRRARPPSNAS